MINHKRRKIEPWPSGSDGFKFLSGDMPRLQVQIPMKVHKGGSHSMFLSHIDVSLSLSLSLSLPVALALSLNKHILE